MRRFSPDTPLRLSVAVQEAFPAGRMTVSGLCREAAKGRLEIEVIAGKHFTTLAAIERMRELCRRQPPKRTAQTDKSSVDPNAGQLAQAALKAKLDLLRKRSNENCGAAKKG